MTKKSKFLIVCCSIICVILIAMTVAPFLFKDKIKEVIVRVANEQLKAELVIGDFGLSLFSNFPNATVSVYDTYIKGEGVFANDTLLQAQKASVTINLSSLFNGNYEISRILLDNVGIYAKVLEDGQANWDIMEENGNEATSNEGETPFNLSLKKISVSNCNIAYEDLQAGMKAVISRWDGNISGDFSSSETILKTNSVIGELSFLMDNIPYLNKVKATVNASLDANLDEMKFTFAESNLTLNELKASIEGTFAMPEEGMDFDLKLNAPDTQFKDILSILPAMYTSDFKDVRTSGTASLDGYLKGRMEGDNFPAFDFKVNVENAMFQYPSLPKPAEQIFIGMTASSKGGSLDNTIININSFRFNLGGNPFGAHMQITTPMSDPNLKLQANGKLDLSMIKDVYPLEEGIDLNGLLTADLNLATSMSAIEKERYGQVSASGSLKVNDMLYRSTGMPDVKVNDAQLTFTPQHVVAALNVNIGKNDLSANGRLDNLIAYALQGQTLKGNLNVHSNYLNANDFLGEGVAVENKTDSIPPSEDIIIPKNIDFLFNADMKQVIYEKITISNMKGGMTVKDGILTLQDVSANALGGNCTVSGTYDTSDPETPQVNFALNLKQVSFTETFKSVESVQKFAPVFESLLGNYSMNLNFNTRLGDNILQTLGALTGSGAILTNDVKVGNVTALTALSSALKTDALNSFSLKDLNLPFTIKDGKLTTKPFNMNMGNGISLKLEGSTGLDQTINYTGTVTLPKALTNSIINNVPVTIGGTFTKPEIGIDVKSAASAAVSSVVSGLLNSGKNEEEKVDLNEEKAKQIERIREEANQAADRLTEEAQKQAQALEGKANNVITKAAARVAGQKLVEEAEKQAERIRTVAEEQIKKLEGDQ